MIIRDTAQRVPRKCEPISSSYNHQIAHKRVVQIALYSRTRIWRMRKRSAEWNRIDTMYIHITYTFMHNMCVPHVYRMYCAAFVCAHVLMCGERACVSLRSLWHIHPDNTHSSGPACHTYTIRTIPERTFVRCMHTHTSHIIVIIMSASCPGVCPLCVRVPAICLFDL